MARKTAVVVGSLGVIGRNLVHHLEPQDEWDIVGLSRRTPDFPTRMRAIAVDLLDEADLRREARRPHRRHARLLLGRAQRAEPRHAGELGRGDRGGLARA